MNLRSLITSSLATNLALLLALGWVSHRSPPGSPAPEASPPPSVPPPRAAAPSPPAPADPARPFHWSMLESEDFAQYLENLRAVGCPESTARDILIATVERRYAEHWDQVRTVPAGPYWDRRRYEREAKLKGTREFIRMAREKRDLLRSLLDTAVSGSGRELWWFDELAPIIVSCVSPENVEEVLSIADHYGKLFSAVDELEEGVRTQASERERLELLQQCATEVRARIPADQFEELELRLVLIPLLFRGGGVPNLEGYFQLTGVELRELVRIHRDLDHPLYRECRWKSADREEDEGASAKALERLRPVLGEARFVRAARLGDSGFENLWQFAHSRELSDEVAERIDDLRKVAQETALGLAQRKEEDSQPLLARLQEETGQNIERLLGETHYQAFLAGAGTWVTNLASHHP